MYADHRCQLPCNILSSKMSPNRTKQLVGHGGQDGVLYVYPFGGNSALSRLQGLSSPITSLGFSTNQNSVLGGSNAGELFMWNLTTEQITRSFKGHKSKITDVEMHTCGHLIASVSTDTFLRIWDMRKNTCVQLHKDAKRKIQKAQFSPNVKWVAIGCEDGNLRMYNLGTASLEASFQLHGGAITSLQFHPEMYFLLAGSEDGTVSLWNLEKFESEFRSNASTEVSCVQFGAGNILAASNHQLRIWETQNLSNGVSHVRNTSWGTVSDMVYASFSDEVWFVETSGSTAVKGRFPIQNSSNTTQGSNLTTDLTSTSAMAEIQLRSNIDGQPKPNHAVLNREEKPPKHDAQGPGVVSSLAKSPVLLEPSLRLPHTPFVDCSSSNIQLESELLSSGTVVNTTLRQRYTHLGVICSFWYRDQRSAVRYLKQLCMEGTEGGIVHDFLINLQKQTMKERLMPYSVPELLEVLQYALQSPDERLIMMALRSLRSVYTKLRLRFEQGERRNRLLCGGESKDYREVNKTESDLKLTQCAMQVLLLHNRHDAVGEEAQRLIPEITALLNH